MAVTIALLLIGLRVMCAWMALLFALPRTNEKYTGLAIGVIAFSSLLAIALGIFIARGRNWARIVFLILAVVGVVLLSLNLLAMLKLRHEGNYTEWPAEVITTTVLPLVLLVAIVVLLFGPGRDWFRPRE
jgi:hypothetical protein